MKIRRIQIVIEPSLFQTADAEFKMLHIEVLADGRRFSTQTMVPDSDFQDTFGYLMQNAERQIRDMVAGKNNP